MDDGESEHQALRTSSARSFLKRFKLRDVQAKLGHLKRTVTQRTVRQDSPSTDAPVEPDNVVPPYKEIYIQNQAAENVLNELHSGYFEGVFDPVEFQLLKIDDDVGQEEVDAQVEQMTQALEVVSLRLSQNVTEKNDHFTQGIETVASIESDLQQAHVSTVNARIKVRMALEEVRCSAAIAKQNRQKQRHLEVLNLLDSVKNAVRLKQTLREVLENGDYIEAMMICAACFEKLETLGNIKIALDLKQSMHSLYLEMTERIDAALYAICTDFRPDAYKNILQCFLFQDTTAPELSDKIIHAFQESITKASSRVVRSLIVTKPGLAESIFSPRYELSFSEMCNGLPFDLLRPCLAKLLEVLFDIICSYHCMSAWHEVGLKHAISELERVETECASQEDAEAAQKTVQLLCSVNEVLVESRKVIWDSAARRVRDLLSGPAAVEGEHFLQVMEWCQKFLKAGEAFIHDTSDLLRSIITLQCGKFFQSYHGTNLDALEMLLRSEQFFNISLPVEVLRENGRFGTMLSSILDRDMFETFATDSGFDASDFDAWIDRGNPFRAPSASDAGRHGQPRMGDADLMLGFGGASNMEDDPASQRLEVNASGHASRNGIWSSDSISTTQSQTRKDIEAIAEEEDEAEDPELFGQDIDEETQTVRMQDTALALQPESTGRMDWMLTNSAHQILKWMKNYCALLKPLSSRSVDIFSGICDLFDGYFSEVFLFVSGMTLTQLVWEDDLITTRLKTTLLRILKSDGHKCKEEVERIETTKPPAKPSLAAQKLAFDFKNFANRFNATRVPSNGAPSSTPVTSPQRRDPCSAPGIFGASSSPRHSAVTDQQASVMAGSNLYGLRETVVAVGSVQLVAKELSEAKGKIQSLVPTTATKTVENYFSRTVDATDDLRECAFRHAARRLMHQVFDPERGIAMQIAQTPYDGEEPPESHNAWAQGLGEHISRFSEILTSTRFPDDMVSQMWEHAIKACSEVILDGLSMVRRCTMPGRSLMSLDLSFIESNFKFMAPTDVLVNLRIVDTYIKAFYLPWEDVPKWAELNYAEYGKGKILSLFHLIVDRVNSMEGRVLRKAEIKSMQSQIEAAMQSV